jgi:hypothetical protein
MKSQAKQNPNPDGKLLKVFDTEQESEAMVVRGLLESANIGCDLTSLDAQQEIFPGVGGIVILVREEDARRALRLIKDYRQLPCEDDDSPADLVGKVKAE